MSHPHAPAWIGAIERNPGTEITAIYDEDREFAAAFAAERSPCARVVDDPDDCAVWGAVVLSRNDETPELARRALESGLPTVVEKPGGVRAAELAGLVAIAERLVLPLQVGYFLRHAPSVRRVRRAIDAGDLGSLRAVRIHCGMPDRAWADQSDWFMDERQMVGPFQEDACHVVDIVLDLFGVPERVVAAAVHPAGSVVLGEEAMSMIARYPDRLITIDFAAREANTWIESWTIELRGTKGTLIAGLLPEWSCQIGDDPAGWWSVVKERPATRAAQLARRAREHSACFDEMWSQFVLAADGRPSPLGVSGRGALDVFELLEDAYRMAGTS